MGVSRLKILHIALTGGWAGSERIAFALANNQIKNNKPVMTKKLYQMVLDYNQNIYINHINVENEQDSFYLNEIREHFRRYLVISKKSNTKNQNGYNEKIKPEKYFVKV